MSPQYRLPKTTLQRSKTKPVVGVALQNKLHETIAKAANAVVENNRVGFSLRQRYLASGSLKLERLDVVGISLIPMRNSLFRAG